MGFWGIEVKPGTKVNPYEGLDTVGRLRITQATLGNGSSKEKSVLQCYYGEHKGAVNLCSLLPNKIESSLLDLEIEEEDGLDFSVSGSQSIHLSGYFLPEEDVEDGDDADYGSSDEDAAPMCCSDSECSEFGSEDDYDVVDSDESDIDLYSPVKKSGVVIEEITDDQDAAKGNSKPKLLKNKSGKLDKNPVSPQEVVARTNSGPVLESEDEDGFPTSHSQKSDQGHNLKKDGNGNSKSKKREMKTMEPDDESERQTKKKKKKQKKMDKEENDHKEASDGGEIVVGTEQKPKEVTNGAAKPSASEPSIVNVPSESNAEKKKKKKKKNKSEESNEGSNGNQQVSTAGDEKTTSAVASGDDKKKESKESKASQVRTFPNGMIVEEIQMGRPDGKKAAPGKQVAVHYIGKLKKNGNIFDSNVGRAPFKFRLGVGQVIKGWDIGVNGMRVGDKRRLTLPPSMGYGAKGAGGKIPPNAWLMFDVELVDVR